MAELFSELGIDWRLLISQGVNFLLLLVVLRAFVYKPVLKLLTERRERIEQGYAKAEEADRRLNDANSLASKKLAEAEEGARDIVAEARDKADKDRATEAEKLRKDSEKAQSRLVDEIKRRKADAEKAMKKEQAMLIKQALIKTVELAPEAVDEALINRALEHAETRTS